MKIEDKVTHIYVNCKECGKKVMASNVFERAEAVSIVCTDCSGKDRLFSNVVNIFSRRVS